jgi:hypothetical protein
MQATFEVRNQIQAPLFTKHASNRMSGRGLSMAAVMAAIAYGHVIRIRGADIHAIGRKEIKFLGLEGIDVSHHEGVQVVCSREDGAILTVYRNRDFGCLRPRRIRRRSHRRSR